jgi:hypothetical protein
MPAIKDKQPRQGRQEVTTTAKPITQIGLASSAATTFTKTNLVSRVTDGAAWNLANVEVDMLAKTSGGWFGRITAVNNGANYVEVEHWQPKGQTGHKRSAQTPDDGETVVIHKMELCQRLIVDALDANTNAIFLGFASDVTASGAKIGQPIAAGATQPNHRLVIEAGLHETIDLTEVYVIVAIGTEDLAWLGS